MAKNILKILSIFIVGAVGGIFADQILWPYFIERPLFYQYRLEQTPIYVTEKKETTMYVQENFALREAVEKVAKVVAGVKTKTEAGEILEGSGLAVTSDGLIVTLASLVPQGSAFSFFIDDQWPNYQILKRDLTNNLALVKIESSRLSTVGFADLEKTKVGERVFLIGTDFSTTTPRAVVNEGIISFFSEDLIKTNIFEDQVVRGSPLFNLEGKAVGLNILDETGRVQTIPINVIRAFIGL